MPLLDRLLEGLGLLGEQAIPIRLPEKAQQADSYSCRASDRTTHIIRGVVKTLPLPSLNIGFCLARKGWRVQMCEIPGLFLT
jgi:hypothetical protein